MVVGAPPRSITRSGPQLTPNKTVRGSLIDVLERDLKRERPRPCWQVG